MILISLHSVPVVHIIRAPHSSPVLVLRALKEKRLCDVMYVSEPLTFLPLAKGTDLKVKLHFILYMKY